MATINEVAYLHSEIEKAKEDIERLKSILRAIQSRLDFRPLGDEFKARDACDAVRNMVAEELKG